MVAKALFAATRRRERSTARARPNCLGIATPIGWRRRGRAASGRRPPGWAISVPSIDHDGLHDAVEDEFERPVRLPPEQDLWSEQSEPSLSDPRVDDGDAPFELLLAPGPPAAQRGLRVEPTHA